VETKGQQLLTHEKNVYVTTSRIGRTRKKEIGLFETFKGNIELKGYGRGNTNYPNIKMVQGGEW